METGTIYEGKTLYDKARIIYKMIDGSSRDSAYVWVPDKLPNANYGLIAPNITDTTATLRSGVTNFSIWWKTVGQIIVEEDPDYARFGLKFNFLLIGLSVLTSL
mgnify:FL=1|jgi:hypothetical protein|tara:strand:- start:58 stop:369 length:312 start_codon:yes stop_codon:yes gene_type:complete